MVVERVGRRIDAAVPVTTLSESALACGELRGDLRGAVGIDGRAHRAGQHDGAAGDLAVHVRARNEAGQQLIERRQVGADRDLERQDLLAVLVEEEGVGLAGLLGDQEHPVGGLHDGVEHARVGDQHVLQRDGELHDDRATDAEVDPLRQRERRIAGNAQHRIAGPPDLQVCRFISAACDVADASRDEEHRSHAGASPF